MKMEGHASFAEAAAEAIRCGYWPIHRRDSLQVYVNDAGDMVAFARDGCGTHQITREFPIDKQVEEIKMTAETNTATESTHAAAAHDAKADTAKTNDASHPKEGAAKKAPAKKEASSKARSTPAKGSGQVAKKTATKAASVTPKASSTAAKKPAAKAAAKTASKAPAKPASKAKTAAPAKAKKKADGTGPRAGSGADLVVRLAKAGKTDEQILAIAAKELPKVKSVNDPRGIAWYRWQAKKNGWL